jgi:hypothetical protein
MAVYVEPARRKKFTWMVAAAAVAVGLVVGGLIGRGTAQSIDDKIADGRSGGRALVTALSVLPLEYKQAASGSSETKLIVDTVDRSVERLPAALDGAPWLGPADRSAATAAVRSVKAAAAAKVAPAKFDGVVARATATLQNVFGLPAR